MKREAIVIHGQDIEVEVSHIFDVFRDKAVRSFLRGYLAAKTARTHTFKPKVPNSIRLIWDTGKVSLLSDGNLDFVFDPSQTNSLQAHSEITGNRHHAWFMSASCSHDVIELISN